MKKGKTRRVGLTITAQTFHHLRNMADDLGLDMGQVVDELVRDRRRRESARNKPRMEGLRYVQK